MLNKDVEHYKAKLQRIPKNVECPCRSKVFESKAVQTDCDIVTPNDQNVAPNGQNDVQMTDNMLTYYTNILPRKYQEKLAKIAELEADQVAKVRNSFNGDL